MNCSTVSHWAS